MPDRRSLCAGRQRRKVAGGQPPLTQTGGDTVELLGCLFAAGGVEAGDVDEDPEHLARGANHPLFGVVAVEDALQREGLDFPCNALDVRRVEGDGIEVIFDQCVRLSRQRYAAGLPRWGIRGSIGRAGMSRSVREFCEHRLCTFVQFVATGNRYQVGRKTTDGVM